ncbi:MAG: RICIN domain-containing protein, partial [Oscillospiraceae bacterium]|nr:RICIN domain-containing protein [Oscillospiraceae bacterium]
PNSYYYITPKKCDKVLDIDAMAGSNNGGNAQLYDKIGGDNQKFKFVAVSDGIYKIICKNSGKPIDIVSGGFSNGAQLHQWDDVDVETQLWKIAFDKNGYVKFISKYSGRVLDSTLYDFNGVRVHIWDDVGSDSQLWKLEKVEEKTKTSKRSTAKKATTRSCTSKKVTKSVGAVKSKIKEKLNS